MKHVEGKVAFITGGASGIGFGMAQVFLKSGMKVIIADVLQERLDEAARILAASTNRDYHFIKVDVTDRKAMAAAADEAERVFGKVHVLCNNAGVYGNLPIESATYEDWDWVLGTNLGGVVNGLVSFLPKIIAHGEGGHIVNTSSMAGLYSAPLGRRPLCDIEIRRSRLDRFTAAGARRAQYRRLGSLPWHDADKNLGSGAASPRT